ncbi:MAG: hypothetical protein HYR66_05620 [Sphingobacteriales bacterium]|nr:hypothetical protein [Sphingobacteriales bacterium]MBI3719143.1 hypothetical protein [Sphingobacteriales bacterium]
MRNLILPAVATLLVLIISCKKNNDKTYDNTLQGTWKEYQSYVSPGAGGEWKNVNGITVTLNTDSTYTSTDEYSAWGKSGKLTELTDSSFIINVNSNSFIYPRHCRYTIKDGVFEVWYNCIEGCGSRFRKNN